MSFYLRWMKDFYLFIYLFIHLFIWKMRLKSIQQLEDLGVVNYIGLYVWTLALGGMYHRDKFEIIA